MGSVIQFPTATPPEEEVVEEGADLESMARSADLRKRLQLAQRRKDNARALSKHGIKPGNDGK